MKKIVYTIALLWGLQVSQTAQAQNEQVTLHVPNFVRPLVEKWVAEYQKTNTQVDFQFKSGKSQDNEPNSISFVSDGNDGVFFARYAVLPVTTKQSEVAERIGSHRLNAKKLKALFFLKDQEQETSNAQQFHIYTGNSLTSASRFYAAYFGEAHADYKGKKISGDDSFLNVAISRDPLGVTINSLSNLFNLESRQLHEDLALLPLELDKQGREVLEGGRLDEIITLLERQHYNEIPVGKAGLVYDHRNALLSDFVHWVLTHGTQYVHEYGLLQLPTKDLAQNTNKL